MYCTETSLSVLHEDDHMKRALEAHMTTVQALYDLYVEDFFLGHPDLKGPCAEAVQQFD